MTMRQTYSGPESRRATALMLVLTGILLASCGLAMNNQDRIDRGYQAIADGDFRSAMIDAKNVLQKEPDNVGLFL